MTHTSGFWAALLRRSSLALAGLLCAGQAMAALTVTPITWDVVGLDSNRPLTSGPELFPVGARICTDVAATDVQAQLVWDSANPYIDIRPGSLTSITFPSLGAGQCADAYFELKLQRSASAFETARRYRIIATDAAANTGQTPTPRAIRIERLVSQNRNTTQLIRYGQQADQSDWQALGGGGTIALAVGQSYFIELTTATSTAYEELQSFLTLSNTIFRVKSVSTTYSNLTAPPSRVPTPNPRLWADGCFWDSDLDSPNYSSCRASGKAGGTVVTIYEIEIISGGGDTVGLEALIYDLSGGSFHYNTDFSRSPGDLAIVDPTVAGFSKRFIPDTIGAGGSSTLRLTISNPNPVEIAGYNFIDDLPGAMVVATPANPGNTCGGTFTATPGAGTVALSGGSVAANSSCSVWVNVTVPFDAGAIYPLSLDNSVNLFVGTDAATDRTGNPLPPAEATLVVEETPPPPLQCTVVPAGTDLARWTTFTTATAPAPTTQYSPGIASSANGAGLTFSFVADEWRAQAQVANQTLAAARGTGAYFEFRLDTTGLTSVDFNLVAYRQNGNAPASLTLDYGPIGSPLVQSTTLTPLPTQSTRPAARNFSANGLTNLNPSGITVFRLYAHGAPNTNSPMRVADILIEGQGTICTEIPPGAAPNPPSIAKAFSPDPVRVGATSTLTFTIQNPNATPLTGVTFADQLPDGMSAVVGSFSSTCGGTWQRESSAPDVLRLTGGNLAANASCSLSVNVTPTIAGTAVNISEPIDAIETLPGNLAIADLEVLPPPQTPSLAKRFDPNPLLVPTGTTQLVFEVTNNDPALAIAGVAFNDPLPAGMVPVLPLSITDNGQCGAYSLTWSAGTSTLAFANGAIAAASVCRVEVTVELPGVDVSGGPVTFLNETTPVSHVFNGVTYVGNDASATLLVDEPIPGLTFEKQIGFGNDPDGAWFNYLAVAPGDAVYYRLTIENTGETPLTALSVSDPLVSTASCTWPASLPVADASAPTAHIAVCIVGPVTVGTGEVINTATASATGGGTPLSGTDTATYAVAALTLDKTASPTTFTAAGDVITYSFEVTNSGDAELPGPVTVTDPLVGAVSCPALTTIGNNDNFFDPGESLTCSASYTITAGDVLAGSVVNTAFASAGGFDSPDDSATVSLASAASLTIEKTQTGGPDPVTSAGAVLDYSIVVTNTGAVTQTGVTVSDLLPDGSVGTLTGPVESISTNGELNVGESWTYTISYTVTQSDLDAGATLVNTASVVTVQVPGPTTDTAETPVTQDPPLLTVVKSAPTGSLTLGSTLTYTVTATNGGNTTLHNVVVSDPLLTPSSETCVTLAPGATCVLTGTYVVQQSDIDAGEIVNTGTADSDETDPPVEDTVTTPITAAASLTIVKTQTGGPDPVTSAGAVLDYSIVVTNTGAVTQTGVTVSDLLPDGSAGTLTGPVESISTNGELNVGESWTYTISYTVTQSDLDAGVPLVNTASVVTVQVPGPTTDTAETPVTQDPPLLTVVKSAPTGSLTLGSTLTYTVTATNAGNTTLHNVVVSDPLLTPSSETCVTLAPGATCVLTGTYVVQQSDIDAGEIVNTGTADSDETDPPVEDTVTTPITAVASLTIEKTQTGGPSPVTSAGAVLGYSIVVTNTGAVTQTGVNVSDLLPDGSAGTLTGPVESISTNGELNVGESWTYTISYTVTQADMDAGATLVNTASVVTVQVPGPTTDTAETPVTQDPPLLTVVKSAPTGNLTLGSTLTYTVTATNGGNTTLHNVVVSDPLLTPSSETCVTLAPGATCVLTGTYVVQQSDIDAGQIVNTGTADSDETDPPVEDTVTTPINGAPDLQFGKTDGGVSVEAGGTVLYTLTWTNAGTRTAPAAVLTETVPAHTSFDAANSTPGWTCVPDGSAGSTCSLVVGDVVPGPGGSAIFAVTVDLPLPVGTTQLSNTASIADDGSLGADPTPGDNSASDTTPVVWPSVTVDKRADPPSGTSVSAGDTLTYTVTAVVADASLSADLVLEDTLGAGLSFGAVTNAVGFTANTAASPLVFTLAAGTAPGTYSIEYTATVDADASGSVGNAVVVADDGGDPDPVCSTCTTDHPLLPADLGVTKTLSVDSAGSDGLAQAGETLTYTVTVRNSGGTAATVPVNETVPAHTTFAGGTPAWSCAVGAVAGTACDASVTVPAASGGAPGEVTLSFSVRVDDPLPAGLQAIRNAVTLDGGTPPDCVATPAAPGCAVTPVLAVAFAKTVASYTTTGPTTYRVVYRIDVQNTGGAATSYTVQDTLGATASGVSYVGAAQVSTTGGTLNPALPGGQFTPANGSAVQLSASDLALAVGATHTYHVALTVRVDAATLADGQCDGTAGHGLYNAAQLLGAVAQDSAACQDVEVDGRAAIRLTKTVELAVDVNGNRFGDAGDVLNYAFEIRNIGTQPLAVVHLLDEQVADLECDTQTLGGQPLDVLRNAEIFGSGFGPETLAPGDAVLCWATHTLTAQDVAARRVVNTATASGRGTSGGAVSSTSTAIYTGMQ